MLSRALVVDHILPLRQRNPLMIAGKNETIIGAMITPLIQVSSDKGFMELIVWMDLMAPDMAMAIIFNRPSSTPGM